MANTIKDSDKRYLDILFSEYPNLDDNIYIIQSNSGEASIVARLAHILKARTPDCTFVATKKYHLAIFKIFAPNIKIVFFDADKHHLNMIEDDVNGYNGKSITMLFTLKFWENQQIYGGTNFFESALNFMCIKIQDVVFSIADLSGEASKSLMDKIKQINLNLDNFVILSPEAISSPLLTETLWNQISEFYYNCGFDIFLNTVDSNIKLKNSKSIFLTFEELYILTKMSKSVIGLRSGLFDIVGDIEVPMFVFYTTKAAYDLYSLNHWFKKKILVNEICCRSECENLDIEDKRIAKRAVELFEARKNNVVNEKIIKENSKNYDKHILNLDENKFYFALPSGLGDTMLICGFRKTWEKQNNEKICFIVKPRHEIIMKMYEIKDYILYDLKSDGKNIAKLGAISNKPEKGKIFIAHPAFVSYGARILDKFESCQISFLDLYRELLFLNKNSQFLEPIWYPEISNEFSERLNKIAPLDKIALICPESNALTPIGDDFWIEKIKQLSRDGYIVVCNVVKKENTLDNSIFLDMTTEEVVALAARCAKVLSMRSGLSDLICTKCKNIEVFYPNVKVKKLYSLIDIFESTYGIKEYVVNKSGVKVTIVTVVYNLIEANREKIFVQCLESIHNQDYYNIEHIIIDGASTDGTLDLIKKYEEKDWIKYYSEPDEGIYDAMNKGIKKATGDFIAFLNSDDYYDSSNVISTSVEFLEENNADFSFGTVKTLRESDNYTVIFYPNESVFMHFMPFSHQSMLCKKDVLIKEDMFDTQFKLAGDLDLIIRLYLKGYKSIEVPCIIAVYRMGGMSDECNRESVLKEYTNVFKKNYDKFYKLSNQEAYKMADKWIVPDVLFKKVKNHIYKKNRKLFEKVFHKNSVTDVAKCSLFNHIPLFYLYKYSDNGKKLKLFNLIELFKIKNSRTKSKISILHINIFSIRKNVEKNTAKVKLFGFIPLLKVKNKNKKNSCI